MAENKIPQIDGEGSPLDEDARNADKEKREAFKRHAKEKAEFLKAERDRRRRGLNG